MGGISCKKWWKPCRWRLRWKYRIGTEAVKLFDNAIIGVEAVLEALGVLVGGVLGQHLAGCGALEGLEACLALDGEGGGILEIVSREDVEGR